MFHFMLLDSRADGGPKLAAGKSFPWSIMPAYLCPDTETMFAQDREKVEKYSNPVAMTTRPALVVRWVVGEPNARGAHVLTEPEIEGVVWSGEAIDPWVPEMARRLGWAS